MDMCSHSSPLSNKGVETVRSAGAPNVAHPLPSCESTMCQRGMLSASHTYERPGGISNLLRTECSDPLLLDRLIEQFPRTNMSAATMASATRNVMLVKLHASSPKSPVAQSGDVDPSNPPNRMPKATENIRRHFGLVSSRLRYRSTYSHKAWLGRRSNAARLGLPSPQGVMLAPRRLLELRPARLPSNRR